MPGNPQSGQALAQVHRFQQGDGCLRFKVKSTRNLHGLWGKTDQFYGKTSIFGICRLIGKRTRIKRMCVDLKNVCRTHFERTIMFLHVSYPDYIWLVEPFDFGVNPPMTVGEMLVLVGSILST